MVNAHSFLFPFLVFLFSTAPVAVVDDGSVLHSGEATFYGEGALGHCGFPPEQQPKYHGAMNHIDYDSAAACGVWVHITGPMGEVTAFIDDECPECKEGDIDLGPITFNQIAESSAGRVPITWRYIEGAVDGPISYYWQTGSSQWHIAVQIRNHRYAIESVEIRTDSSEWITMTRRTYNYFELEGGVNAQEGPYSIRVADIFGRQLIDSNLTLVAGDTVSGKANFPGRQASAVYKIQKRKLGGIKPANQIFCSTAIGREIIPSLPGSGTVELYYPDGKRIGAFSSPARMRDFIKKSPASRHAGVLIVKVRGEKARGCR